MPSQCGLYRLARTQAFRRRTLGRWRAYTMHSVRPASFTRPSRELTPASRLSSAGAQPVMGPSTVAVVDVQADLLRAGGLTWGGWNVHVLDALLDAAAVAAATGATRLLS